MEDQAKIEQVTSSLKERVKEEFMKCAQDPVYFMKKYYMIQHPQKGRILFNLYPFQEKVLKLYQKPDSLIINKSRQLGISTLVSAYSLWLMLFNRDKNILVIATKQETAKNMVTKVRFAYQNLPTWLKVIATEDNRLSLRLSNGSQVKAVSAAADAARSEAVSLLVLDEAAFIDNAEQLYTSAQQTLATGGKCIAISTPNGMGNWFEETFKKAQNKKNSFIPVSLPWTVHPERSQEWRDQQDRDLGLRNAAQECFSGDTRIFTSTGMVEIKDIKVGDKVLTHSGRFKSVTKLYKKEGINLIGIKTSKNTKQVYVTQEHPVQVNEESNSYAPIADVDSLYTVPSTIDIKKSTSYLDLYELVSPLYFKKVCLGESFYINDRRHKTKHNCNIELGYKLGKIIGLYLAEGSKSRLRVTYSFNYVKEINTWVIDLQKDIESVFGLDIFKIRKQGNTGHVSVNSEVFSQAISLFVEGTCSLDKKLSKFFYDNANEQLMKGVLEGYLSGDGCLLDAYNKSFTTVSENLYYDIYYISNLLGANNLSMKYPKDLEPYISEILGRDCLCHPKYTGSYLKTKDKALELIYKNEDRVAKLYKEELEEDFRCYVYNLEVEEDHTYVTEHGVVHNCDCDFATSGATVILPEILKYYEDNFLCEPVERRGLDKSLWIWEYADPLKYYVLVADVARGDGADYSAFHVIDTETLTQVAEYQAQIDTREYANVIISVASEYNNALLVIENANIGWDVIQSVIDRGYTNLYYSHKVDTAAGFDFEKYVNLYNRGDGLIPGFSTTSKTRPLVVEKMRDFVENKLVTIKSIRLLEELRNFIWKNGKTQAMQGRNDDLVMAFSIGLYLRDSSLRYKKTADSLTYASLGSFTKTGNGKPIYNTERLGSNPWSMDIVAGNEQQVVDLSWLIG